MAFSAAGAFSGIDEYFKNRIGNGGFSLDEVVFNEEIQHVFAIFRGAAGFYDIVFAHFPPIEVPIDDKAVLKADGVAQRCFWLNRLIGLLRGRLPIVVDAVCAYRTVRVQMLDFRYIPILICPQFGYLTQQSVPNRLSGFVRDGNSDFFPYISIVIIENKLEWLVICNDRRLPVSELSLFPDIPIPVIIAFLALFHVSVGVIDVVRGKGIWAIFLYSASQAVIKVIDIRGF